MKLGKYSFGIGDRFAHQGKAQLVALLEAQRLGVAITPVWNKSHREHSIIKTAPASVRAEADHAVSELNWLAPYFVDADHISLKNVGLFLEASDFFTLDVADFMGQAASADELAAFLGSCSRFVGELTIPGIDVPLEITAEQVEAIAGKVLRAVKEAGRIYRHIEAAKGKGNFVTEISMDETDLPQTPVEMLFILLAVAEEDIPAQTIAPKFTGRFNKGVDYVGDVEQFTREFEQDLAVIAYAVKEFCLPADLKLSVHSGSDKFSIYGPIGSAIRKFGAGLHLKTAGTTWLEELIGLAEAGDDGLTIAQKVYSNALGRFDELCGPYATVIDINKNNLPSPDEVKNWDGPKFARTLRHDQSCGDYNPNFRQLLHVGYKVAAELGDEYLSALKNHEESVAKNVFENIMDRHIRRIFAL